MKFYQLHKMTVKSGSAGYTYFTRRDTADLALRHWEADSEDASGEITVIDIKPTRRAICEALNKYADHPDNG